MRDIRSGLTAAGLAAVVAAAGLLSACGAQEQEVSEARGDSVAPVAVIDRDPYAIACAHVRNQDRWARVTRRATVALADRARIPKLNRLRASQSIYYAMTELCKDQPASFTPAAGAVSAVRAGTYRVGR